MPWYLTFKPLPILHCRSHFGDVCRDHRMTSASSTLEVPLVLALAEYIFKNLLSMKWGGAGEIVHNSHYFTFSCTLKSFL